MTVFDTPAPIVVELELGCGAVRITASDRTETIVDVRPSDPAKSDDIAAAEQTRVEYAGGRLLIQAARGWKQWLPWRGGESIDVQIELPAGSDVRGEGVLADLRCTGRVGECRYKTSLGNIQVDQAGPVQLKTAGNVSVECVTGSAEVTTATGMARIDRIHGPAVIKNNNGDTWIGTVTGDLQVNAANGNISVDRADSSVAANTANGDIRLGEVVRGLILAQTARGRIEVGVRDGVAAWLDLDTQFGQVQSDLDAAPGPEPGEDTVEVRASTSFGDITIRRCPGGSIGKDSP